MINKNKTLKVEITKKNTFNALDSHDVKRDICVAVHRVVLVVQLLERGSVLGMYLLDFLN